MNIHYSRPLSLGWDRMRKALFQPFDITKWVRIGFTAWLASFTDCSGGGTGGNSSNTDFSNSGLIDEFFKLPETAWQWLTNHPVWFNLIIAGIILTILIISILMWLSSRGKFMFLHNVVNDRADVSYPWNEYKKEGNSLFLWQFIFGWISFGIILLLVVKGFITAKTLYYSDHTGAAIFQSVVYNILLIIGLAIVFAYISLFLKDFVAPIMYKKRIGVIDGWREFLTLFYPHILAFLGYGLFMFLLGIVAAIAIVFFAIFTCCIGLILLAIPFIGAVILLPISYLFRAFSLEFLKQFGDDYNVFPLENDTPDKNIDHLK
ncbi:MAG: hypothetical protein CSA36_02430 [Draconibacterium sp.]|nr:MAG: hypothetical protein CSA36_02430 [Draconibacterium sp.]